MPTTSNFGWTTPADTDLVKDGALAIRTLGNGIDTSMAQLKGGTTGQVLSKTSNTDMAFTWVTQDDANAIQNAIVDAKGDLIAATANDTPARLAVGNNGETLVADSSTSTGLRYTAGNPIANPIINSGFDIAQRGTSFSLNNSFAYTLDRWYGVSNPASTITQQATGDTTNLPNIRYCMRVQRNAGNTNTNILYVEQAVETANAIPFAGRTVTLSFYARAGANYSPTSSVMFATLQTGTGVDQKPYTGYTGSTTIFSQSTTLTTAWQRFSYTGTIGATATEFAVSFAMYPTGTAGANDYFELTGVQIDVGSVALPYRRAGGNIAGERSACERYYFRINAADAFANLANSGYTGTTTAFNAFVQHPTTMRSKPTSIDWSNLQALDVASAQVTLSNPSFAATNTNNSNIAFTATGATANRYAWLRDSGAATGFLGLSAEL